MALKEIDVLKALSDPLLQRMNFFVDSVHVRGTAYQTIFDLIKDEQILVVEGKNPNRATYDPRTDTLETQNVNPPADLFNRSILIHECTHAIKDMEHVTITQLGNEAAAYTAQATYLLLSNSKPLIPPGFGVVNTALALARKFRLDTDPGMGVRIPYDDIVPLVRRINSHPSYAAHRGLLSTANGISPKGPKESPKLNLPASPEPSAIKAQDHAMNAYRVPSDVLFDFNKHDIKRNAEKALGDAVAYIEQFMGPGARIYITGHTDSIGGDGASNNALSKRRADAVAQWLIRSKHVDATRVVTDGAGASKPVAPNNDPFGRERNRRVEILIML